ncbi:unnamed protein product [Cochlearia groenlandica]
MAVDAHHLLLSPPQLFPNRFLTLSLSDSFLFSLFFKLKSFFLCRDLMMNNNNNTIQPPSNLTSYGVVSPFSVTTTNTETSYPPPLLQMYGGGDTIPTTAYYADNTNFDSEFSPFTTRKRPRVSTISNHYHQNLLHQSHRSSSCFTLPPSFLGENIDLSSHLNQQHHEIDRFVFLHMERIKIEIQEKRKKQAKTIMEAIEHGLSKRLRVKEEERDRIWKINHALEERVKSLSVENQIWRELAQTNEATANNLRENLEHVMAQVKGLRHVTGAGLDNVNEEEEDAESCCGSSSGEETVRRTVDKEAHDKTERGGSTSRMCRNCGEEESCVLILPCRHLGLCGVCGSSVHTCPICRSPKNASVHVNMSL